MLANFGKSPVSYEQFKRKYMPFEWDRPTKNNQNQEGTLLTADQWYKIINGTQSIKQIKNANDLPANI